MSGQNRGPVRRAAMPMLALCLAVVLTLTAGRGVRAGAALVAGPSVDPEPGGQVRNRPLAGLTARDVASPTPSPVALGEIRDGLVMVFDTTCGPCAVNMGNWADLAREARGHRVELVALTIEPARGAVEYWRGWRGVRVLAADTATVRNDLRLVATPTTLLVEDGVVRRSYTGPLSPAAMAEAVQWIRRR